MKIVRTIWLVAFSIAFWPLMILAEIAWFIWCVRCAKRVSETVIYGAKMWWRYIKAGIEMNKDFVKNGLFGA